MHPRTGGITRLRAPNQLREWELERRRFFEDYNAAYDGLRADPDAWKEELRERASWDPMLVSPDDLAELD
ncbi:MAG TPA: hypothetical protein VF092_21140 [Longimicrobium sp.]